MYHSYLVLTVGALRIHRDKTNTKQYQSFARYSWLNDYYIVILTGKRNKRKKKKINETMN